MILKENEDLIKNPKPFLRWAGGKRWFVKYLEDINKIKINNYFEPFVGGGSVFFNLKNYENAFLSDLNSDLIETYEALRDNVIEVILALKEFRNDKNEYYKIRSLKFENKIEKAAQFIYLNQTSFNGIYRVNRNGNFNVPFGNRNKKDIIEEENLLLVHKKLENVNIICGDFEDNLKTINKGDLVFLDPPYTVAHEKNGFIQYNQKIFSLDDQFRLSKFVKKIEEKGAFYILTNAKHQAILEIYKDLGNPVSLKRSSTIGGLGAKRGKEGFNEYIFSNCLNLKTND
ncbi:Dam family site-specific DNA-(adenine-N6)-methyltransferase [Elizabethkingia anophelis]|uniref:Site-specific DNA-methyltransferase (adenine-specific) n=3 Tax=Elizabethkingia anophelis TaxID=1117645 RepID=A0ABN5BYL8_9FLAO|nr:Dam family site-specific DNA-(adenine-N6)-methyltransferase [Elizabethkingia anophelis]ATC37634.1 DNA adenine methylase [Elizabethkingia anophelis R26]ATC41313.1 DNA adenine methylase [Elizabethkingia anophelis Ag1]ATC44990.1 DNA adenine methylase [Elizabethkingia anophelis]ATC48666.1 DNA adenine methylase [Elizabethkingia anophelis]ELR81139.1 DNA adenine methylase [Elizabethkingia anophelis R26]